MQSTSSLYGHNATADILESRAADKNIIYMMFTIFNNMHNNVRMKFTCFILFVNLIVKR